MIRIDYALLGYVVFKIDKNDISSAAEILLDNNISIRIDESGSFFSSLVKAEKIQHALVGKVKFERSLPLGIGGMLLRLRFRYGFLLALLLSTVLFLYLNSKVWDVRVYGVSAELCEVIKDELSQNGLYVGASWNGINKSRVEAAVLSGSDAISWLNINRRGTVAYVSAVEKNVNQSKPKPSGYANIVADRDCIIEDIIVRRGVAAVKIGESVKKGDLLISGIIPTELGGGFCYANGEFRGRYSDTVAVKVSQKEEYKIYTDEHIKNISLNIFNFSINIFKNYRNLSNMCDIIEEKSEFLLDGGKSVPIFFNKTVAREYSVEIRSLTEKEMSEKASELLRENLFDFLSDKELVSIKTGGKLRNSEYELKADLVVSRRQNDRKNRYDKIGRGYCRDFRCV